MLYRGVPYNWYIVARAIYAGPIPLRTIYEAATNMRNMTIVVEGISPCCYQKKMKVHLKRKQPWTTVSVLLGLTSMVQLSDELSWVPT